MKRQSLTDGIKLIAWGYILLHLNINFVTINVLPNWLGYILILRALPVLGEYEPSALLIRPIGIGLAIWEGVLWVMTALKSSFDFYIIGIIASVISLYFHFQLLTNLADVSKQFGCEEHSRILTLRTVRTVLMTLLVLPFSWNDYFSLTVFIIIVNVIVALWINVVLFSVRFSLGKIKEKNNKSLEN